jgi:hypothetical protein
MIKNASILLICRQHFDKMTEEELTRFEFFVRSTIPRKKAKLIMKDALNIKEKEKDIPDEMAIAVCSLTKLFVGEVCDTGGFIVDLMQNCNY